MIIIVAIKEYISLHAGEAIETASNVSYLLLRMQREGLTWLQ